MTYSHLNINSLANEYVYGSSSTSTLIVACTINLVLARYTVAIEWRYSETRIK